MSDFGGQEVRKRKGDGELADIGMVRSRWSFGLLKIVITSLSRYDFSLNLAKVIWFRVQSNKRNC